MIKITRDNYELYAIDYVEGALSIEESKAFKSFLNTNPDIATELESLPTLSIDSELSFTQKEQLELKKGTLLSSPISLDNCEYYFIAFHENDLSKSDVSNVKKFLRDHPSKLIDFEQLSVLRFQADNSISYADKNELKKAVPIAYSRLILRVAAIFIFLSAIGLYLFMNTNDGQEYTERKSEVELPIEDVVPELITEVIEKQEASPVQKNENHKVTEQLASKEEIRLPTINENTLVIEELAEVKTEEAPIEIVIANNEINDSSSEVENTIVENVETPEEIITVAEASEIPINDSDAILKIKRPQIFNKQKEEDQLLASNDDEVILRISKPFKNSKKKDVKFGPIKIKRKKG